jgi:hypothetical protein
MHNESAIGREGDCKELHEMNAEIGIMVTIGGRS